MATLAQQKETVRELTKSIAVEAERETRAAAARAEAVAICKPPAKVTPVQCEMIEAGISANKNGKTVAELAAALAVRIQNEALRAPKYESLRRSDLAADWEIFEIVRTELEGTRRATTTAHSVLVAALTLLVAAYIKNRYGTPRRDESFGLFILGKMETGDFLVFDPITAHFSRPKV